MNIIDLRKNLRESVTGRLISDRRQNTYAFGTQEWLDYIKQHGLKLPTHDSRKINRRASDNNSQPIEAISAKKPYVRILLTPAEKKLLDDMYLSDLD